MAGFRAFRIHGWLNGRQLSSFTCAQADRPLSASSGLSSIACYNELLGLFRAIEVPVVAEFGPVSPNNREWFGGACKYRRRVPFPIHV
jgi:hypothetical protein